VVLLIPDHVANDPAKTTRDFREIAATIKSEGVRCTLARHRKAAQVPLLPLWLGKTVSISMVGRTDRKLLPGKFLAGLSHNKVEEYRALEQAGAPVPRWEEVRPGTKLNPDEWGSYVVVKPSRGWLGAEVRIKRIGRVQYKEPSSYPAGHFGRRGPMILQKFIYTGEWPVSWRVVTVFGKVVLCYRQTTVRGQPLKKRWGFDTGGVAIVSNTAAMRVELDPDQEIMNVARSAHLSAFPDIPVLHFDIARDVETGEVAIFECHPHHPYWPFASKSALALQAEQGLSFHGQFDAMPTIGRAIVEKVRSIFPTH
jgi:hypothetical protein